MPCQKKKMKKELNESEFTLRSILNIGKFSLNK